MMEKIYQIAVNASSQELDELVCLLNHHKIRYETGILLFFELRSKNEYTEEILKLSSEKFAASINVFNRYSPKEIRGSKYLALGVRTHSAYPQPESRNQDGQNYIDFTYDTLNSCQSCGHGKIQCDSFYLKRNFTIKNPMRITQLYWIYDTFFVAKAFKELLERENFTGIEIVPSKYIQDRKKREDLFQIRIKDSFPLKLNFEARKTNACNNCGQLKYVMEQDSPLSCGQAIAFDGDFYLSQEFFGDGLECFQLPIISQRLYRFLEQNKVKNMTVQPIFEMERHQPESFHKYELRGVEGGMKNNIEKYKKRINKVVDGKAFFILCDGYDGWSWGMPVNPICFNYTEYETLLSKLKEMFGFDLEKKTVEHNGWDCILPDEIAAYVGKRVATFTSFPDFIKIGTESPAEEDWDTYLFKAEDEKQESVEAKKALLQKMEFYTESI